MSKDINSFFPIGITPSRVNSKLLCKHCIWIDEVLRSTNLHCILTFNWKNNFKGNLFYYIYLTHVGVINVDLKKLYGDNCDNYLCLHTFHIAQAIAIWMPSLGWYCCTYFKLCITGNSQVQCQVNVKAPVAIIKWEFRVSLMSQSLIVTFWEGCHASLIEAFQWQRELSNIQW